MSSDRRSEPDARMLRRMVRELSEEPLPELPWERIEARLFAELEEGGRAPLALQALEHPHLFAGERFVDDDRFADEEDDERISALPEGMPDRPSAIPAAVEPREAELVAHKLVAQKRPVVPGLFGRSRTWVVAAAIAASFGGLFTVMARKAPAPVVAIAEPIDPSTVPQAPGMAPGVLDASSLRIGDIVEAALGPLAFGSLSPRTDAEPGALSWTLSAGSRALVHEPASAAAHVIELESGSLRAEASGSKRFIVRVSDTEIASVGAGSVFTVTRSSRGLMVHVEVGSVVVGERGRFSVGQDPIAAASSRILTAPVRAAVLLDGTRQIEIIPDEVAGPLPPSTALDPSSVLDPSRPAPVGDGALFPEEHSGPSQPSRAPNKTDGAAATDGAPAAGASAKPGAPPAGETPATPAEPPAASGPISEASIKAGVQRCFADVQAKKAPNDGVLVSVSSTLRVAVRADGSVQGVAFSPPLQGDLQSCAVFLFRQNLGPGARSLSIAVSHR